MVSFIKKIVPSENHSTPLNVQELKKKDKDKKTAVVIKPLIVAIGSAIFCLAGFSFWIYVQFFLSP